MPTVTHTRTRTKCHAWAETLPWTCLIRDTGCISARHDHSPMVDDRCFHPDCDELLVENEVCYAVIEIDVPRKWVCWRHVVDERDEFLTAPIKLD